MSSGAWSALISGIGLVISIVGLAFLVAQLRLLRHQIGQAQELFVAEQDRAKRQSTLEFMANTIDRKQELHLKVPYEEEKDAVKDFLGKVRTSEEARKTLWNYLNYHETIATGVNCGIFEIDVVARSMGATIVRVFDAYRDIIMEERAKYGRPKMYWETETLAHALRKRYPRSQRISEDAT